MKEQRPSWEEAPGSKLPGKQAGPQDERDRDRG
jgi:hypothetical protein